MKYKGTMEKEERMMAIQKGAELEERYRSLIEQKRELQKHLEDLTSALEKVSETQAAFFDIYGLEVEYGKVVLVEEVIR